MTSFFRSTAFIATLALLAGLVIGGIAVSWQSGSAPSGTTASGDAPTSSASSGDSASVPQPSASGLARYDENGDGIVYQGGMHPDVVQDEPGSCPVCGMQLTPVRVDGSGGSEGTVRISPVTLQNVGVRTARVRVDRLSRQVRTTGRFAVNEEAQTAVSPKVSGWIDELYVSYEGARVQKGEPLFAIYSPELVATQEEYLTALRNAERLEGDAGSQRLVEAARRRLAYWDISEAQIDRLETTRTPQRTLSFTAPVSGTVTRKTVTEGEKIASGQTLMQITDLSTLWLMVDVYEQDLSWIGVGSEAEVRLPYASGRTVQGRVDHVYDEVDGDTRTVTARVRVPNPDRSLKPGMYATVTLSGTPAEAAPVVPQEAVVGTGDREAVVLALGDGRFRPVPVTTGLTAGGETQVLSGLDGGERVVTSAQFLIDSEARLQGALGAMTESDGGSGGHDHGAMGGGAKAGEGEKRGPEPARAEMRDGVQVVDVTVTQAGFSPERVALEAGVPARLVFTRTTTSTCATDVQVPAFDVAPVSIPMNEPTPVRFTPDETGTFTFACGMDMITGTLVVKQ